MATCRGQQQRQQQQHLLLALSEPDVHFEAGCAEQVWHASSARMRARLSRLLHFHTLKLVYVR